jgi:hypothetical protein
MIKLFSDIFITKGYRRSVLQDLGRSDYYFIPNLMAKFIKNLNGKIEYLDIQKRNRSKYTAHFNDYYTFLEEKELIFDIDKHFTSNFPPIRTVYEFPHKVINISIFFSEKNMPVIKKAFENNLFINVINMHFFIPNHISFKDINYLFDIIFSKSSISIQIELGNDHGDFESFNNLMTNNSLIKVIPHNSEITTNYLESKEYRQKYPFILNHYIQYYEATEYNTFLNKRIYIDPSGSIKPTPRYDLILGNINDLKSANDLEIMVENIEYKNSCSIHRGTIEICKDCELRMMCIDDKIPINNGFFWTLEEECSYNPYICKWQNEEGHISIKECGTFTEKSGFVPNNRKIAAHAKEIWGKEDV